MEQYPAPTDDADGSWQERENEYHDGIKHALITLTLCKSRFSTNANLQTPENCLVLNFYNITDEIWRDQNQARISKMPNEFLFLFFDK